MNCDRQTTFQDELSLNFADFIIIPFNWAIYGWLPDFSMACKQVASNRQAWHEILMNRLKSVSAEESLMKESFNKWESRAQACADKVKLLS
jgi:hypothetical protein